MSRRRRRRQRRRRSRLLQAIRLRAYPRRRQAPISPYGYDRAIARGGWGVAVLRDRLGQDLVDRLLELTRERLVWLSLALPDGVEVVGQRRRDFLGAEVLGGPVGGGLGLALVLDLQERVVGVGAELFEVVGTAGEVAVELADQEGEALVADRVDERADLVLVLRGREGAVAGADRAPADRLGPARELDGREVEVLDGLADQEVVAAVALGHRDLLGGERG